MPFASESEPICSKTDSSQSLGTIYIIIFKNLVISLQKQLVLSVHQDITKLPSSAGACYKGFSDFSSCQLVGGFADTQDSEQ